MKLLFGNFSGKKVLLVHHSYFSLKDRGSLEAHDIIFQSIFSNISEEKSRIALWLAIPWDIIGPKNSSKTCQVLHFNQLVSATAIDIPIP